MLNHDTCWLCTKKHWADKEAAWRESLSCKYIDERFYKDIFDCTWHKSGQVWCEGLYHCTEEGKMPTTLVHGIEVPSVYIGVDSEVPDCCFFKGKHENEETT